MRHSNPYIASLTSQLILQPFRRFTYVTAHSTTLPLLHLRHRHFTYVTRGAAHAKIATFSNSYTASPTSQLILQPFRRFTSVTAHSTTLPLLHLRHRHFTYVTRGAAHANIASFYNPYIASPTSQLILQPFYRFTYVKAHSTTLPLLHLRHMHFTYVIRGAAHAKIASFSNPYIASPTSQLILQPFHRFTYVTAHSKTLPLLHLRHQGSRHAKIASFCNPYTASPTSQLILQPFCRFTYVTAHSTTIPLLHLCHRHFTYVTRRPVHAKMIHIDYFKFKGRSAGIFELV